MAQYRFTVDTNPDCPSMTVTIGDFAQVQWTPEWPPAFDLQLDGLPSSPLKLDGGCGNGEFSLALERGGAGWSLELRAARYGNGDGGSCGTTLNRLTDDNVRALVVALARSRSAGPARSRTTNPPAC